MRTVAVERAEPGPELPVYHCTVSAEPLTSLVAGELDVSTLSGGCCAATVPLPKPSADNAPAGVMENVEALGVLMVTTPPWTVDGVVVPVIWSIFDSSD